MLNNNNNNKNELKIYNTHLELSLLFYFIINQGFIESIIYFLAEIFQDIHVRLKQNAHKKVFVDIQIE